MEIRLKHGFACWQVSSTHLPTICVTPFSKINRRCRLYSQDFRVKDQRPKSKTKACIYHRIMQKSSLSKDWCHGQKLIVNQCQTCQDPDSITTSETKRNGHEVKSVINKQREIILNG